MISLRYERGVELPPHGLWLDPSGSKPFAFVSHAHGDHIAAHGRIIASAATARLMRERLPGERIESVLEFGKMERLGELDITLLSAGHILGSSQFFMQSDAGSLLYTGDFKLRPSLSAEATQWRHADTLIMETTFGIPKYRLPPAEQVIGEIITFCRETLDAGGTPVLLAYSLGKAQETLCALARTGFTAMLHDAVWRMTRIYCELLPDFPQNFVKWHPGRTKGHVLICPPGASRSPMFLSIPSWRTAILTGWAVDSSARFRHGCDAAFALSDHADYDELLRYVELVQPERVFTVHGFATEFAADLRRRGIEAWSLGREDQLELPMAL